MNQNIRPGCKDVWNAFLVSHARYAGIFEFPIIQPTNYIPNRLIAFSKAICTSDYNQWVHFYEDDWLFERLWRNPGRYLETLRRFNGVILPDFSLYRDMPFVMQLWNVYRSRAVGAWLQQNGIKIIVNIRFGDRRTYRICCDGVFKGGTIAVGTHGTLKNVKDREIFAEGLKFVIKRLQPSAIVVYGSFPQYLRELCTDADVEIHQFESDIALSHQEAI